MKWKSITELPSDLVGEDVFLRIELRLNGDIIYAVGDVSELGDVYAYGNAYFNGKYFQELDGFISRDIYKTIWYVDPKEIELTK